MKLDKILKQLIKHEGIMLKSYKCTSNKASIGIGRNLEDNPLSKYEKGIIYWRNDISNVEALALAKTIGITKEHAIFLCKQDIRHCIESLRIIFANWEYISEQRKFVLIDMLYNLGVKRFLTFEKMIECIKYEKWIDAGNEMKDSKWYEQVKNRADRLIKMMIKNKYFDEIK